MNIRQRPLLVLLSIVLISLTAGIFGGAFFSHHHKDQFLEEYGSTGTGAPTEIGDAGPFYVVIGICLGILIGLAVGICVYVVIKQRAHEAQYSILSVRRQ